MVVIVEQLGMFGYALKHPVKKANHMVANNRNLTSLTLSCELGRDTIFQVINTNREYIYTIFIIYKVVTTLRPFI